MGARLGAAQRGAPHGAMADTRTPRQGPAAPRTTKPPLPEAEESRIRAIFQETDEDGSGELDQNEIEAMLVRMGRKLSKAEAAQAMAEMDLDGSGDVDFGEFREWYLDQKLGTSNKFSAMVSQKARSKFNGEGLPRKWSGPKWLGGGSAWEQAIEEEGLFAPDGATAQVESMEVRRVRKLFQEIDLDGSGALDRTEVTALIRQMGQSLKKEEVDAAMLAMDADGSGEVDFNEFKDWWLSSAGSSGKFAAMVADAAQSRFDATGLPKMWRGPSWTESAEPTAGQDYGRGGVGVAGADGRAMASSGTQERQTARHQRAAREWAARTLRFDPALARSHQGLPLRTLQQAYRAAANRLYQEQGSGGVVPPPPERLSLASKWFRYALVEAAMDSGVVRAGVLGTINSGGLSYERWDDDLGATITTFCALWREDNRRGSAGGGSGSLAVQPQQQQQEQPPPSRGRLQWRRPEKLTEAELQQAVQEWATTHCAFDTALLPGRSHSRSRHVSRVRHSNSNGGSSGGGGVAPPALQQQGASAVELRRAFEADSRIDLSGLPVAGSAQRWFAAGMVAAAAECWKDQNASEGVCGTGSAAHLAVRFEAWDETLEVPTMVTRYACVLN